MNNHELERLIYEIGEKEKITNNSHKQNEEFCNKFLTKRTNAPSRSISSERWEENCKDMYECHRLKCTSLKQGSKVLLKFTEETKECREEEIEGLERLRLKAH